jgi:predicted nuclease of predicted toxin-antitoxin system
MSPTAKFLLDQMFDRHVLAALRQEGYDVVSVAELGLSTADDAEIMQQAIADGRVVITLDEHFGDWSVLPLTRHPGVIRLKINPTTTATTLTLLLPFLARHAQGEFANRLVIVRENRNRWIKT